MMIMNDAAASSGTSVESYQTTEHNITDHSNLDRHLQMQTRKITDDEQVKIWKEVAMM
jgi:hypothetical protein